MLSQKEEDRVQIQPGQWTEQLSVWIRSTSKWPVREFLLYNNQRISVLKQISHIEFTSLTFLDLQDNEIQSIEVMPSIQMPHIERLNFSGNKITSVKEIRKGAWPALKSLNIVENGIRDVQDLEEAWFSRIEQILVYNPWEVDRNYYIDHCFPLKLQTPPSLKYVYILEDTFCFDRSA